MPVPRDTTMLKPDSRKVLIAITDSRRPLQIGMKKGGAV